ncbi:hypothetical protein IFM89_030299 [Coptis chinensis]|uniref:DUF241 domain protein n=1 Tax=Coptis chinensis TaxID=261450 RepID=A0A835IT89_9MAGN|nr:hypothetical protein IFM89_030299 [Coptis chinensis]
MAASPLNLKTPYHVRSISLPSISHPLTADVEEQLCQLRSSGATCSSSPECLNGTYNSVENLLQLSLTQKALSSESSNKSINEVLDGTLHVLDICSTTRDVFLQIKECVQDLQSSVRRKGELGLANEVGGYMTTRKKVNKVIQKCLSDLKKAEDKNFNSSLLEKDDNLVALLIVLKEVEAITLSMIKSLLSSVLLSKKHTKAKGWSFVSKLMHTKRVACQGQETDIFGLEELDVALFNIVSKKTSKGIEVMNVVQDVQKQLDMIMSSMQGLDKGLECMYKSIIKTRVSLLNIMSQ